MASIIAVSPSNVMDEEKMKYLLESAEVNKFKVDIIGIGQPFTFLSTITLLRDYLDNLDKESNPIVCYTDAYDVFYLDGLEVVKQKFLAFNKKIVWSAEREFYHQLSKTKSFYDTLDTATKSPYKYLNGGTFMGYKDSLLELFNDIVTSLKDPEFIADLASEGWYLEKPMVDQTIKAFHLYKHWAKYDIAFDQECRIFYIPCGDWRNIDYFIDYNFKLAETGQTPSIIHMTWKAVTEHVLQYLFNNRYRNRLANKAYSWGDSHILFKADGTMEAFGVGRYYYIDAYTVRACFGTCIHTLHFNNNHSYFISIRKGDHDTVRGNLVTL